MGVTSWKLSDILSYVSSTFLYLLRPLIQAIDPSCLAQQLSRKNICSRLLSNLILVNLIVVKFPCLETYVLRFWGVLWSALDEIWRKSSRDVPEPPYLPQNPRFLQENTKKTPEKKSEEKR